MKFKKYVTGDREFIERLARVLPPYHPLRYPDFVDYYYGTSPGSTLVVVEDDSRPVGALGLERMKFLAGTEELELGFGSNFIALESGAGGALFLWWIRSCQFGIVYGGSADTHALIARAKWTFYRGIKTYRFNRTYTSFPGESTWRKIAKEAANRVLPRDDLRLKARPVLPRTHGVQVEECTEITSEMLPPADKSPFALRYAPTVEDLNWRYSTGLSFVRYRHFRLEEPGGIPVGYVIINQQPGRLIVAHCDGTDPLILTHAILNAVTIVAAEEPRPPEVLLTSSHPTMQLVFERVGFESVAERSLALGGVRGAPKIGEQTHRWLVNYDWGDNGLRPPFLGQPALT